MSVASGVGQLPDYGWKNAEAEASHRYLQPVVLKALQRVDAARADRRAPLRVFDKFWSQRTLRTLLLELGYTDVSFRGAGRMPGFWKSMVAIAGKHP